MNNDLPDQTNAEQQRLEVMLRRLASEAIPPVPGNLESRVWREIHARGAQGRQSIEFNWLSHVFKMWREPRLACMGLLAAAVIGISISWVSAKVAGVDSAQEALDLKVFSLEAPSLPSTLLVRAQMRH